MPIRLDYTQRLMLAAGLMLVILATLFLVMFWILAEALEVSEEREFLDYMGQRVSEALQAGRDPAAILPAIFELHVDPASLPESLRRYHQPGDYTLPDGRELLVRTHPLSDRPFHLLFTSGGVLEERDDLEFVFAVLAVIAIACATAVVMLLTARRLAKPVRQLTERVLSVDRRNPHLEPLERNDEIGQLSRTFADLVTSVREFGQREREFTRFASHELRSPVTVLRGSIDLLRESLPSGERERRALQRMDLATHRMSQLIDTFLWLGRGSSQLAPIEIDGERLRSLVDDLVEGHSHPERQRVRLEVVEIRWSADLFLLTVVLDNLLRNALAHCVGVVVVTAAEDSLSVSNPTEAAAADTDGHGYGLEIVARVCEASGWQFSTATAAGSYVANVRIHPTVEGQAGATG